MIVLSVAGGILLALFILANLDDILTIGLALLLTAVIVVIAMSAFLIQ